MEFKTNHGRIEFDTDHFNFYINTGCCDCEECEYCTNNNVTCRIKVIDGHVADVDSGEKFEELIYNYFREVGADYGENTYEMGRNYDKYFKIFEQYVIDNHKPTGRFTKPARYL